MDYSKDMSSTFTACNCPDPVVVEIPGVEGTAGTDGAPGADGLNAYTLTTEPGFTVPSLGAGVTFLVGQSTTFAVGQTIFVEGAGLFVITAKPASTSMTATYVDYPGNTSVGAQINPGATITPSGPLGVVPDAVAPIIAVDPEGVVVADPGALRFNNVLATFWIKSTGTATNTGWVQLN